MERHHRIEGSTGVGRRRIALALVLILIGAAAPLVAAGPTSADDSPDRSRSLEPSYEPAEESPSAYTTQYFFALTRGVSGSTMVPAAKLPLFVFTIPLDLALLPVSMIAGFFPPD